MVDTGGGAEQDGGVELLGDLAGDLHEILALLTVGGFDHRHLGGAGIVTVILLVLGGMHTGIVGGDDDIAAGDTHIACGEQGIGCHIQTHVLHSAQRAHTGHGGAVSHLGGHLLVRRPLAVDIVFVLGGLLQNLGAGCAGIGGTDFDAGFVNAARDGFVAGKQMLGHRTVTPSHK